MSIVRKLNFYPYFSPSKHKGRKERKKERTKEQTSTPKYLEGPPKNRITPRYTSPAPLRNPQHHIPPPHHISPNQHTHSTNSTFRQATLSTYPSHARHAYPVPIPRLCHTQSDLGVRCDEYEYEKEKNQNLMVREWRREDESCRYDWENEEGGEDGEGICRWGVCLGQKKERRAIELLHKLELPPTNCKYFSRT